MSGKENKNCLAVSRIPGRRSISSPFSSTSKKAASSGVRLPSPARKSITVPLISSSSPSATFLPQLRKSISNPVTGVLKEEQNIIPKTLKCNIKQEAVNPDKVLAVKSLNKRVEKIPPAKVNKPLKPQPIAQKPTQMQPSSKVNNVKSKVECNNKIVQNNTHKKDECVPESYKNE